MVDSTKLRNLKKLNLLGTAITDNHIKQLASSNYFNLLQELILRQCSNITDTSIHQIVKSENFKSLKILDIGGNN